MPQSRHSNASFLTANPGGVAIADAWAYSFIIYGKCSSRSFNYAVLRLEICSARTIESQEYTCEDECFTLEFDMETMRAWMHLKRSCIRKTIPALTSRC